MHTHTHTQRNGPVKLPPFHPCWRSHWRLKSCQEMLKPSLGKGKARPPPLPESRRAERPHRCSRCPRHPRGPAQVIPGTLGTDTTQVGAVCLDAFVNSALLERTKEPEFLQPTSGPRSPPIFAAHIYSASIRAKASLVAQR